MNWLFFQNMYFLSVEENQNVIYNFFFKKALFRKYSKKYIKSIQGLWRVNSFMWEIRKLNAITLVLKLYYANEPTILDHPW